MVARFGSFGEGQPAIPMSARPGPELKDVGYLLAEYSASGTATSYAIGERTFDGHWSAEPAESADFATRVVVRRPASPSEFSGTVLVEWLNVSSGQEASPDWTYLCDEIVRRGHAWVGVSAQWTGIHGGMGAVATAAMDGMKGLQQLAPERYRDLHHPGDAWAYGIFASIAEALREEGPDHDAGPLAGLTVERMLALGESQAAYALTTFINAISALRPVFDGFFVHSRGVAGLTSDDVGGPAAIERVVTSPPCQLRSTPGHPVLIIEAEGDLVGRINYLPARQDDDDWLRLWEVAGGAHADTFQIGEFESFLGCTTALNRGQMVYVLRAGLQALDEWVREGVAPPQASRIEVAETGFVGDDIGNSLGGVRTPVVEAPSAHLVGIGPEGSTLICHLFGQTLPADPEALRKRYASVEEFEAAYAEATDRLIGERFLLAADREAILAEADAGPIREALEATIV